MSYREHNIHVGTSKQSSIVVVNTFPNTTTAVVDIGDSIIPIYFVFIRTNNNIGIYRFIGTMMP